MHETLTYISGYIQQKNPLHGKKIRKNLKKADPDYISRAGEFLDRYVKLLAQEGKALDYAIDCYLQMIADMNYESVLFQETGRYSSTSFEEVNARVYNNPAIMEYYMHGLLMSQFLWHHHYLVLLHYSSIIKKYKGHIRTYLEVGGGHGLYISEATRLLDTDAKFEVVDISSSSLEIARKLINNEKVAYVHSDIFEYNPAGKYDFISMGEVLEHVEDPVGLLKRLSDLLAPEGRIFITTPTNAPTIDHIYLFKNAADIRNVIQQAKLSIEDEFCVYAEDLPAEIAEQYKISMMYAACLRKS
jgi:ubiquinone/menaquinone biosynthesis C-methylase UbiE